MTEIEFAALLVSRVCHDLVGPLGAVVNGMEVLEDERDPAMRALPAGVQREILFDRATTAASFFLSVVNCASTASCTPAPPPPDGSATATGCGCTSPTATPPRETC